MTDFFRQSHDGDVAILELDRPDKKNAVPRAEIERLGEILDSDALRNARCVVLRGTGGVFCAGMDLTDIDPKEYPYHNLAHRIGPVLERLRELPAPTISSVAGPALGFGFGLAMCCDITVATESATFGSPFRRIGMVLDSGGHYFLNRRIGHHRAAELIFTGRMINGAEAAQIGLINRAVPESELEGATMEMARRIASGPTVALKESKKILVQAHGLSQVLEMEARAQSVAVKTKDAKEGLRSFMEKRDPNFTGS
jgi:enoyl-CoA hydratase/carnithine racemase